MDNTKKMLQAIIHGQNALKQELVGEIKKVEEKLGGKIDNLEIRIDSLDKNLKKVDRKLTKRLDNIGRSLAYLEDDTPTKEEFDELVKRVDKIEHKTAVV